jgi:hypothetical protein
MGGGFNKVLKCDISSNDASRVNGWADEVAIFSGSILA